MEQKEKESDNIELRSEKVRNVIGKVPPRLVCWGTVIITIILLAFAVVFVRIIVSNKTLWQQVFGHSLSEYLLP